MDPSKANSDKKQEGASSHQIQAPTISLPKGGGAIRGMGVKIAFHSCLPWLNSKWLDMNNYSCEPTMKFKS
jgi:hypothetical protein